VIFSYPIAFDAYVKGPRQNIAIPFGMEKQHCRIVGLPDGEKKLRICITV